VSAAVTAFNGTPMELRCEIGAFPVVTSGPGRRRRAAVSNRPALARRLGDGHAGRIIDTGDGMPKYLFLQRSQPGTRQQPSPAQMQEMFAAFNAWKEKFQDQIVDMGGKLKPGGTFVTASGATDGPFVEAKEIIGGYMLVVADTLDQAIAVARESPGVMGPGSSVEIREIAGS
jgi:hypothetical protein